MKQRITDDVESYRTLTEATPDGHRALAVGLWLALAGLFAVGGPVLVLAGTAAVTPSPTPAATVVVLAGVLGVVSVAPTLATVAVRGTVAVVESALPAVGAVRSAASYRPSGTTNDRTPCSDC